METIKSNIVQQIDCINRAAVTRFMSKKFAAYSQCTDKLLVAFERLLSDQPDQMMDSVRVSVSGASPMLPLTAKLIPLFKSGLVSKGKPIDLGVKIEILSCLWDCSDALAFPAQVLAKSKKKLNKRPEIWSHFACFGLNGQDRNLFRSIRNCCAHGVRIKDGHLLKTSENGGVLRDCNGVEVKVCSLSDVDRIFTKADLVFSWWMTLIVATAFHSPRFAIILIRAAFEQFSYKTDNLANALEELFPSENWAKNPSRSNSIPVLSNEDATYYRRRLFEILSRLVFELKRLSTDAQDEVRSASFARWAEGLDVFLEKLISWHRPVDVLLS